ncbi:MAG: hypothetical protein GX051_08605 [Clostridiales bacterium]|nr:hypothetical protein [Clostridiales bacterium]
MGRLRNKSALTILCAVAILNPFLFYSCRVTFTFIDTAVFNGFTHLILLLMLANTALWIFLCAKKTVSDKSFKRLCICGIVFNALFVAVNVAFAVAGASELHTYYYYFTRELPYIGVAFLTYFTLLVLPDIKSGAKKAVSAVLTVSVLVSLISVGFTVGKFEFTSAPVVFITDDPETYSVVWSTSERATGHIEYTYNGIEYKIYDTLSGNIRSDSKIHTVSVPREQLDGNTYSVSSQRVWEHLGYSTVLGKTLSSEKSTLRAYTEGAELSVTVFSDWHDQEGRAVATANAMQRQPDLFVILGDPVNMLNKADDISESILFAAGEISHSSCPTVYVRGNHETRGEYASHLLGHLGIGSFYYKFSWGPLCAVVLDTAEDKADNHTEYGGLAAFEPYKNEQTKWLENTCFDDNASYKLVFKHIPDAPESWDEPLAGLGADMMVSGHEHTAKINPPDARHPYPTVIDGGKTDGDFCGTLLVFSGNTASVSFYKRAGLVSEEKITLVR